MKRWPFAVGIVVAALAITSRAEACFNNTTTVSATALNFGAVNQFSTLTDSTATITMRLVNNGSTCTTPITLTMGLGNGTGATAAVRRMTSGANTLNYTLYSDAARTSVWDNTTGVTSSPTVPANTTSNVTATIYGRVFGSQTAAVGSYTDTVIITLTW